MPLFLPDTNILIYAIKGEKPYAAKVLNWIERKEILISAVVAAEFLSGGNGLERDKFQALIDKFGTAPMDTAVARIAAEYKIKLAKRKPKLRLPDGLIAATCKLYGATLVTQDKHDYPMTDITKLSI